MRPTAVSRVFAPLLLAVLPAMSGCQSVQSMLDGLDKPTARVAGVRFDSLSMDSLGLVFDVEVGNPYGVALPVSDIDYALASGGASFLTGSAKTAGSIPAKSSKTVSVPAKVVFAELVKAASGVRPGKVVPYTASLELSVEPPGAGRLAMPLRKEGELPVPAPPRVELSDIRFDELSLTEASGVLVLEVTNANEFAAELSKLGYDLKLAGTPIVAASVAKGAKFEPGKPVRVDVPLSFKPSNLGLAVFNVLRGSGASYDISGEMDVATRFGSLRMPYRRSGTTSISGNR